MCPLFCPARKYDGTPYVAWIARWGHVDWPPPPRNTTTLLFNLVQMNEVCCWNLMHIYLQIISMEIRGTYFWIITGRTELYTVYRKLGARRTIWKPLTSLSRFSFYQPIEQITCFQVLKENQILHSTVHSFFIAILQLEGQNIWVYGTSVTYMSLHIYLWCLYSSFFRSVISESGFPVKYINTDKNQQNSQRQ